MVQVLIVLIIGVVAVLTVVMTVYLVPDVTARKLDEAATARQAPALGPAEIDKSPRRIGVQELHPDLIPHV